MTGMVETARRNLGELAAIAKKTEETERRILDRAQELLSDIEGKLSDARTAAMSGDDGAKKKYTDMIEERGRLYQVIASAQSALGSS